MLDSDPPPTRATLGRLLAASEALSGGPWALRVKRKRRLLGFSWAVPWPLLTSFWGALEGFEVSFSLNTFRYKGLLNCAGEHRGELCWESNDFRAERPRPALVLLLFVVMWISAYNEQPR